MSIMIEKYILPANWTPYLIFGDKGELDDEDIEAIKDFMKRNNLVECMDSSDEVWFQWHNDYNYVGCNVMEYTFLLGE